MRRIAILTIGLGLGLVLPVHAQEFPPPTLTLSGFTHQEYQTGDGLTCTWNSQGSASLNCDYNLVNGACAYTLSGDLTNGGALYLVPFAADNSKCYPAGDGGYIALQVYDIHATPANTVGQVTNAKFGPQLNGCAPSVTGSIVATGKRGDVSAGGFQLDMNLDIAWAGDECQPPHTTLEEQP